VFIRIHNFTTLRLVLVDQLTAHHFWFSHKDPMDMGIVASAAASGTLTSPAADIEKCFPGA